MSMYDSMAGRLKSLVRAGVLLAAMVVATLAAAGCGSSLEEDPEDLALGVAVAAYGRDSGVLGAHAAPSLSQTLGSDQSSVQQAALTQLEEENLPEGRLETEGVQQVPVPLLPASLGYYDVPATDPDGREVSVTVVVSGTEEDDDYEYCAVAVRPAGADILEDDSVDFVLGGEDTCGF